MWLPLLLCAKPYPLVKRKSAAAYFLLDTLFLTWQENMNSGKRLLLILWLTIGPDIKAFLQMADGLQ